MNHLKHLLFLSIICSLVLFTNCGEDEDDKKCVTCANRECQGRGCVGDEIDWCGMTDDELDLISPDRNTYYTEAHLQRWVDNESSECYWD